MICLRPYQLAAIEAMRAGFKEHRAILLALPTGSGKTVLFASVAHGAASKDNQVLILSHRIELIDQISQALTDAETPHGIIAADYPYEPAQCLIASVATLARRARLSLDPRLIIIDEAHHATAATWKRTLERWPRARILGVTATPVRADGAGLGDIFTHLIVGPQVPELQALGFLAPLRVFAPPMADTSTLHRRFGEFIRGEAAALFDRPTVTGDALAHYRRLSPGRRAVVFCVSVEHARHVAEQFAAAGFPAFCLDGSLERSVRRERVSAFRSGRVPILTSCELISEGFDVPDIEVGISLRPTASLGLWLQQVGRCLRVAPGKAHALLLDHAGNSLRHGLPTDEQEWSLTHGAAPKGAQAEGGGIKVCPECWAANARTRPTCTECGAAFKSQARKLAQAEGELTELQAADARRVARRDQGQRRSLEDLIALGTIRGYKNPAHWARHVMAGRMRKGRAT